MTIARDSTSYPYLAVAERFGVPYGTVLAFADAIEASPRFDVWQERAMIALDGRDDVVAAIYDARAAEHGRVP